MVQANSILSFFSNPSNGFHNFPGSGPLLILCLPSLCPAMLVSLLFLEHNKNVPASGPLNWLLLLLPPHPQVCMIPCLTSCSSLLRSHLLSGAFQATLGKLQPLTLPVLPNPFPDVFFLSYLCYCQTFPPRI